MTNKRAALLVGVSYCGEGYPSLPGTLQDIEKIKQVLQDPDMGMFQVESLINPDPQVLRDAIEHFFTIGRTADDVLLFYFSGHGILDSATGTQLYLATCQTHQAKDCLVESSAVNARWLHDNLMHSQSKQKIVILDCRFSGAIANLLRKGESHINFESFKAKGAVILASSSSTAFDMPCQNLESWDLADEVSEDFAQSIYTHYLVEGIKTGAASRDDQDWIYVQDLHAYAKNRVFTAVATASDPQMIVLDQDGFQIPIARAPRKDPTYEYRRIVAGLLQGIDGVISELDRHYLNSKADTVGLSVEEAQALLDEQQQPYCIRNCRRRRYVEALSLALKESQPILPHHRYKLQCIQAALSLTNGEVAMLETQMGIQMAHLPLNLANNLVIEGFSHTTHQIESSHLGEIALAHLNDYLTLPKSGISANTISKATFSKATFPSALGIHYEKLQDFLRTGNWKAADYETYLRMLEGVGRNEGDYIRSVELENFSAVDLKTIDQLWTYYSHGHFGFSVQKTIYLQCGARLNGKYPGDKLWEKFSDRVGWHSHQKWIFYKDVIFSLDAPKGHLPLGASSLRFSFWWMRSSEVIKGVTTILCRLVSPSSSA